MKRDKREHEWGNNGARKGSEMRKGVHWNLKGAPGCMG